MTERRNLFVHTGGVVSAQYLANCKKWDVSTAKEIKEGAQLDVPKGYLNSASKCFIELSLRLVQAAVRRLYPDCYEEADRELNDQGIDFLDRKAWDMAERIFRFALEIGAKHRSKGPWLLYARINLCIALKSRSKKFDRELSEVDWSEMHPQYHLASAVLQDRLDDVFRLMKTPAVVEAVKEDGFTNWPLFRDLRENEKFKNAFREIFGKDLVQINLSEGEDNPPSSDPPVS